MSIKLQLFIIFILVAGVYACGVSSSNSATTTNQIITTANPGPAKSSTAGRLVKLNGSQSTSADGGPVIANEAPTDLVVIGNSLTFVPQTSSIGWNGSWGMAASASEKDFAHLVASSMHLPLTVTSNFAALEVTPTTSAGNIQNMAAPVKTTTMVVIELGDNVPLSVLPEFTQQYSKLLDAVNHARILICISTYYKDDSKDAIIKAACSAHGGRYVFIGNIYSDPANLDSQGLQFSNASVNAHPHDWSMARIAEWIVSAAR